MDYSTIYCVNCRDHVDVSMENITYVKSKHGRYRKKATCPMCDHKVSCFATKAEYPEPSDNEEEHKNEEKDE